MADDELAAIRAARLAQLKAQGAGGLSAPAPPKEQSGPSEEMKRTLLYQILSPEARERLARIKIVKEQKANAVEEMIVKMAQSGQIRDKVSEKQLIDLLEQLQDKRTLKKRFGMMRAFVLGSLNIDHFLSLDHIVQESETLQVLESKEFLGGKGANQAVAVALTGADTVLVANVGINESDRLIKELMEYRISPKLSIDKLTGQAIIQVDRKGENAILLLPNANKTWDFETIYSKLKDIRNGDYIILQNEVSLDVIKEILRVLKALDLTIVLNPAPFTVDVLGIIEFVDLLVLNRIEGEQLLSSVGIVASSPKEMAQDILIKLDCSLVVVTLGALGLVVALKQDSHPDVMVLEFEAMAGIHPVDSTGAGDCFVGYFVGSLMEYGALPRVWNEEALRQVLVPCIKMGIVASGLSTLKQGTIVSYPDKKAVLERIKSI